MAVFKFNRGILSKRNCLLLIPLFVLLWLLIRSDLVEKCTYARLVGSAFRRNFDQILSSGDAFFLASYNILTDPVLNISGFRRLSKSSTIFLLALVFVLTWLYRRLSRVGECTADRETFVEPVFRRHFNRLSSSGSEFCLVSYNILFDPFLPGTYLPLSNGENSKEVEGKNSSRHRQFMKEIKWLDPDVINLQEVEKFYFPILVEELGALGFEGDFNLHRVNSHGIATFHRTKRFQKKKTKAYYFNDILKKCCEGCELTRTEKDRAQRSIRITLLEEIETGKQLVIANTHVIHGGWTFPDISALQTVLFLRQIHEFISSVDGTQRVPWLFSGDFNAYPFFPVYELITTGKMSEKAMEKLDPGKYKYPQIVPKTPVEDKERSVLKYCKNKLSHSLQDLRSAYSTVLGSEPPLTHYQINRDFPQRYGFDIMKGTLDYIFYSSDSLKVNAVLEPVKEEVIKPLVACPNKYFPSDHLSLKACFSFKQ